MKTTDEDRAFTGSIPELYERYLVPMIFEPYAEELARRLAGLDLRNVLEIAAGTGAVTRALAKTLPPQVAITATDLNQAMLDKALKVGTARPIHWRQADAVQLPFGDDAFDAAVCQFGVMFFPDKPRAFAEARRVLRPGGVFLCSVWDRLQVNDFADTIEGALAELFPDDPPHFMGRTPHGYCNQATIAHDLAIAGFSSEPEFATVTARSRAPSAQYAAAAYCQGTPLRTEIESRGATRLDEATQVAATALESRFGSGAIEGSTQALVVTITT